MSDSENLNRNQKRALVALLEQPTVTEAAEVCGLTRRTLHEYLADPVFKQELRARQDQVLSAVTAAMAGLTGDALRTLQDVMADPDASQATKVRAALGWLQQTQKQIELQDLVDRLDRLEEVLERQGQDKGQAHVV